MKMKINARKANKNRNDFLFSNENNIKMLKEIESMIEKASRNGEHRIRFDNKYCCPAQPFVRILKDHGFRVKTKVNYKCACEDCIDEISW